MANSRAIPIATFNFTNTWHKNCCLMLSHREFLKTNYIGGGGTKKKLLLVF